MNFVSNVIQLMHFEDIQSNSPVNYNKVFNIEYNRKNQCYPKIDILFLSIDKIFRKQCFLTFRAIFLILIKIVSEDEVLLLQRQCYGIVYSQEE